MLSRMAKEGVQGMSKALVRDRQRRIGIMRKMGKASTKESWVSKKKFIAIYCMNHGVRKRLALEYFDILLDAGIFDVNLDNKDEFKSLEAETQGQD